MAQILNNEQQAKEFFLKEVNSSCSESVILYHNQRKTVLRILKEIAELTGRGFVEMDLSSEAANISSDIFENKIPKWLAPVFEKQNPQGYIVYFREFAIAPESIKNSVMNIILKKEVQVAKFPDNTFIILGVLDVEGVTGALSNIKSVIFYKQI